MKLAFGSIVFVLTMISAQAFADSGLRCTMTYKSSNPFSQNESSSTQQLFAGQSMKGSAASEENSVKDGAHSLLVSKTTMNRGQNGWTVRVYDDAGVDLGTVEFREDAAMKVIFPVTAWATGNEDPPKYDVLEVSCFYTDFAG